MNICFSSSSRGRKGARSSNGGLTSVPGAIVGGLMSYPMSVLGALLVGQLESFSSFWASAFKEVIVFTLIIPVLWWRSLKTRHVEDEE